MVHRVLQDCACHAVICAAICATFGPAAVADTAYLSHDDPANFVTNGRIQTATVANIGWIVADGTVLGVYEPVALLFKLGWTQPPGRWCHPAPPPHLSTGCLSACAPEQPPKPESVRQNNSPRAHGLGGWSRSGRPPALPGWSPSSCTVRSPGWRSPMMPSCRSAARPSHSSRRLRRDGERTPADQQFRRGLRWRTSCWPAAPPPFPPLLLAPFSRHTRPESGGRARVVQC